MPKYDERSLAALIPAARTNVAYENNGVPAITKPQSLLAEVLAQNPWPIRWERGVALFRFADVPEATRNAAIISNDPHRGIPIGLGSEEPLIPLNIDRDEHRLCARRPPRKADDLRGRGPGEGLVSNHEGVRAAMYLPLAFQTR